MDNKEFVELCKEKVVSYTNTALNLNSINPPVHITTDDVYVVWLNRTLQNNAGGIYIPRTVGTRCSWNRVII